MSVKLRPVAIAGENHFLKTIFPTGYFRQITTVALGSLRELYALLTGTLLTPIPPCDIKEMYSEQMIIVKKMVSTSYLLSLFLIFIRITTVLMTAPIFSSRSIPALSKISFAGLLSIIILPVSKTTVPLLPTTLPTHILPFLLIVAQEILIGALIGFVSNLVFMTIGMAAGMIGLQTGFRAANLLDPFVNVPSSALEQFYTLLAMALFLSINGHHWLIRALVRTFQVTPVGTFALNNVTIEYLIALTSEVFISAVRIALPVVGTVMLTDIGLGLVARAVPQIQVFFVGLPLKVGLGFFTLAITLALTFPFIKTLFSDIMVDILTIISR
ncbi:MAG: flagellar biosynthetic protein FliR [Chloroflexota bacterium]